MKGRVAVWSGVGALVVVFWMLYFKMTFATPHGIAWALICLTCPISMLRRYPMSFYVVLLVNAGTYALMGLVVETMRGRYRHPEPA
jgi:hypothetical protein